MERVHFHPEAIFRQRIGSAWERESRRLRAQLPDADLQHVGSTAVPGALTKGDLDIQVRVPSTSFAAAEAALAAAYARNAGNPAREGFASFEVRGGDVEVGIQLTSIDGADDSFWRFRELLLARKDLQAAYDALKRAHDGGPMDVYRRAKDAFFTALRETEEYRSVRSSAGR